MAKLGSAVVVDGEEGAKKVSSLNCLATGPAGWLLSAMGQRGTVSGIHCGAESAESPSGRY